MAYAFNVTSFKTTAGNGQTATLFKIEEIDVGTTDEYNFVAPTYGTIVKVTSELVSGAGANITPIIGMATGDVADTFEEIFEFPAAGAFVSPTDKIGYAGSRAFISPPQNVGPIHVRSRPNAGADNVVTTIIIIVHGSA